MCTPPFCEPARRCLGCISLRKAASLIVVLNALYGFLMVVIHMFIFRERSSIMDSMKVEAGFATTPAPGAYGANADGGGITSRHKHNWYLQVLDLNIAWAHGVLGLGDWYLCMLGLLYGIVVIAFSLFVLHAVITHSRTAGVITRWFMMFLHLELFLYIALVLIKLPLLCTAAKHFLTLMDEDCRVLRYMYTEMSGIRIIIGSLCVWVFSSFAYLLAWGDAAVDDPSVDDDVDQGRKGWTRPATSPVRQSFSPPRERMYPLQEVRGGTRASFDQVRGGTRASFDRISMVGEAVSAPQDGRYGYDSYEPRYVGTSKASFPPVSGGGYAGGSFAASSAQYPGQYVMPRAHSSIQSNATDVSQQAGERQMLIKPPIVIH